MLNEPIVSLKSQSCIVTIGTEKKTFVCLSVLYFSLSVCLSVLYFSLSFCLSVLYCPVYVCLPVLYFSLSIYSLLRCLTFFVNSFVFPLFCDSLLLSVYYNVFFSLFFHDFLSVILFEQSILFVYVPLQFCLYVLLLG
jgi:hypothetical protein